METEKTTILISFNKSIIEYKTDKIDLPDIYKKSYGYLIHLDKLIKDIEPKLNKSNDKIYKYGDLTVYYDKYLNSIVIKIKDLKIYK